MNELEILDLLSNDVKVVDHSTREVDKRGVHILRFPGELMPDGKGLMAEVPERLDPTVLKDWCETVRREWNARQNRKAAEAKSKRDAAAQMGGASGGDPGRATGGNGPAQAGGEAREASLEELVEAQVARLIEKVRSLGQVRDEANRVAAEAVRRHEAAIQELGRAERTLAHLKAEEVA